MRRNLEHERGSLCSRTSFATEGSNGRVSVGYGINSFKKRTIRSVTPFVSEEGDASTVEIDESCAELTRRDGELLPTAEETCSV